MKNIKLLGLVFISLLSLSSCKVNFLVDVYSSDIFLDKNVITPAKVKIEIPSCSVEKVTEYGEKILALFSQASKAKIVGCEQENMASMLIVSFNAEMISQHSDFDVNIFRAPIIEDIKDGITYEMRSIAVALNPHFLSRIKSLLEQNYQTLSYDDVKIEISLNNDDKDVIIVAGWFVWVDGQAYEKYENQLEKREKIHLLFPNVISDLILQQKQPVLLTVIRPKDKEPYHEN